MDMIINNLQNAITKLTESGIPFRQAPTISNNFHGTKIIFNSRKLAERAVKVIGFRQITVISKYSRYEYSITYYG